MSSDADLIKFNEFIKENIELLTATGIFGALMSYLPVHDGVYSFLNFLSIVFFIFFVFILIKSINKSRKENKKENKYIYFFMILLLLFSGTLIIYTLQKYGDIIGGIIVLILTFLIFFKIIDLYDKFEKFLEKSPTWNILIFMAIILFFFILTMNKITFQDGSLSGLISSLGMMISIPIYFISFSQIIKLIIKFLSKKKE